MLVQSIWRISKAFEFCYGHRVHNQTLDANFSIDSCLSCRHIHGHQGKVIVSLEGERLTGGMITDFKHLNWFKKWIDDVLDHKLIMDSTDPLLPVLFPKIVQFVSGSDKAGIVDYNKCVANIEGYSVPMDSVTASDPQYIKELYQGLVIVQFVPTSENLSKWLFDIVSNRMRVIKVKVSSVAFYETPKSMSEYYHAGSHL